MNPYENFEELCLLGEEIIRKSCPPILIKSFFDTGKFNTQYSSRILRYTDDCLGIFNRVDSDYREILIWSPEESPKGEELNCVKDCWQDFKEPKLFRLKIKDYADGYYSSSCQVSLFGKNIGGASAYSDHRYPDIKNVCRCAGIMSALLRKRDKDGVLTDYL